MNNIKKLTTAGVLVAASVCLSAFSIPIGASMCYPIQHLVNVIAGVFLGPAYGVLMAFCTSLIRNFLGTGTIMAFPGSMVGAFFCGWLYHMTKKLPLAYVGEIFGTGILGGMLCYPIAVFVLGKEAALFTYVVPFLVSTVGGTVMAAILLTTMEKMGVLDKMKQMLNA